MARSSNTRRVAPKADPPFTVRDCALIAIATGRRASTLRELHESLLSVTADSLYHHFWGGLLAPRFEEREYNNDFAAWARHGLHDGKLAEQLAVIDPTLCPDLEALRQEILTVVEERLDESEYLSWARATYPFEFIRSQVVVFDTGQRAETPESLARIVPELSASSIFYHFIEARRRLETRTDDFSQWLADLGGPCGPLVAHLADIDPYFCTLPELRDQVAEVFHAFFAEGAP